MVEGTQADRRLVDRRDHERDADAVGFARPEPSLGELFSDLTREFSTLFREEARLAQVELTAKASKVGKNLAFLAVGGLVAYAGFLVILLAVVIGLSYVMADWLAASIVGLIVVITGAVLLNRGLGQLQEMNLKLDQTAQTLKENTEFIKEQIQ